MSHKRPMTLKEAVIISARIIKPLRPFCERVIVAGSIRRQRKTVNDIEITCKNCKVNASGNIDLGENGAGVITGGPKGTLPVCFVTGAPMPCSATVTAKR